MYIVYVVTAFSARLTCGPPVQVTVSYSACQFTSLTPRCSRSVCECTLNPRPTGTPDFPSLTEGEVSISVHIDRREKWKKNVRKLVKNDYKTISSHIFAQVKIVASRGQKCPKFRLFHVCRTTFRKTSNISGIIIAMAHPTASFEKKDYYYLETECCRQIWPKVISLDFRSHQSKTNLFSSEIFHCEQLFHFLICSNNKRYVPSCLSRRDESIDIYGDIEKSTTIFDLRSKSKGDLIMSCCISFEASGQGNMLKSTPGLYLNPITSYNRKGTLTS